MILEKILYGILVHNLIALTKQNIKVHQILVHNLGENILWYHCNQGGEEGCNYRTRIKSHLRQHQVQAHNFFGNNTNMIQWYHCNQEGCTYKAKQKSSLKDHQLNEHNIILE